MGHREDLLRGAKRCIRERGLANTTARDIVAASGASLASIGYYFGSKDELLNTALVEAFEEWAAELGGVLAASTGTDWDIVAAMWDGLVEAFGTHRELLVGSTDAFSHAAHSDQLRQQFAAVYERARPGLAVAFGVRGADDDAHAVGTLHLAIVVGLAVQWLFDPASVPSGRRMAEALRSVSTTVGAVAEDQLPKVT